MSVNVFLLIYIIHNLHEKKEPLPSHDSTKLSKGKGIVSRNYNYDEDLKKYCIVIENLIINNLESLIPRSFCVTVGQPIVSNFYHNKLIRLLICKK